MQSPIHPLHCLGYVGPMLKSWLQIFPASALSLVKYSEMANRTLDTVAEVLKRLGTLPIPRFFLLYRSNHPVNVLINILYEELWDICTPRNMFMFIMHFVRCSLDCRRHCMLVICFSILHGIMGCFAPRIVILYQYAG